MAKVELDLERLLEEIAKINVRIDDSLNVPEFQDVHHAWDRIETETRRLREVLTQNKRRE